jgi:antitoxin VapB
MALSIKDPEADRLARELAEATGESLTEAVTKALRERLRVVRGDNRSEEEFLADIRKIVGDFQRHPIIDRRSEDEILGYDEYGLPTR